ncbi:MAG: hypothetical protein E6K13_03275 [Methanobacteriota archaeon]|nr:MAG: hypothetical protein E6K13_03275 [Euryarchaeota archaeon]
MVVDELPGQLDVSAVHPIYVLQGCDVQVDAFDAFRGGHRQDIVLLELGSSLALVAVRQHVLVYQAVLSRAIGKDEVDVTRPEARWVVVEHGLAADEHRMDAEELVEPRTDPVEFPVGLDGDLFVIQVFELHSSMPQISLRRSRAAKALPSEKRSTTVCARVVKYPSSAFSAKPNACRAFSVSRRSAISSRPALSGSPRHRPRGHSGS